MEDGFTNLDVSLRPEGRLTWSRVIFIISSFAKVVPTTVLYVLVDLMAKEGLQMTTKVSVTRVPLVPTRDKVLSYAGCRLGANCVIKA